MHVPAQRREQDMSSTAHPRKQSVRFYALDGIRGVAAIAVMLFHLFPVLPGGMLGHGYLAVDLFFLLSGFVIAYTYEAKLANGWSLARFTLARAIRLYPLVVAAVLAVVLLRCIYPHRIFPSAELLSQAVLNALLVPNLFPTAPDQFPIIGPSWSLFYELVVNIAYAACLPFIRKSSLPAIIGVSGVILFFYTFDKGSVSLLHHDFVPGFARTAFSFFIGIWIFRNLQTVLKTKIVLPTWACYGTLLIALAVPVLANFDWLFEIVCIAIVFPLFTISAIKISSVRSGGGLSGFLGELSYPIYVLHMPVAAYVGVGLGWAMTGVALQTAAAIATVIASYAAWKIYDLPIRRWLTAQVGQRQPKVQLRAEP